MLFNSLLHFGIMHVNDGVSGVSLPLLEMPRPHVVYPIYEVHLDNVEKKMVHTFIQTAFI